MENKDIIYFNDKWDDLIYIYKDRLKILWEKDMEMYPKLDKLSHKDDVAELEACEEDLFLIEQSYQHYQKLKDYGRYYSAVNFAAWFFQDYANQILREEESE